MQHPLITGGGKVVRTYRWKRYRAVLVQDPDSFGPIKYRYVMIVYAEPGDNAVMFVTAERNEMQAELFEAAREALNDPSFQHDPSEFFLGVFDQGGRRNLGGSPNWGELVEFERQALGIVRATLAIEESVTTSSATNPERTEPKIGHSEIWDVLAWLREVLLIYGPLFVVIFGMVALKDVLLAFGISGETIALFLLIGIAIAVANAWFWTFYLRRKARNQRGDRPWV